MLQTTSPRTLSGMHFHSLGSLKNSEATFRNHIIRMSEFGLSLPYSDKKPFLLSQLNLAPLSGQRYEVWTTPDAVEYITDSQCEISKWERAALVRIALPEQHTTTSEQETGIAKTSYEAYSILFQKIKDYDLGNLVRVWNYVPDILSPIGCNVPVEDREQYRQFNAGRADAWEKFGPRDPNNILIRPAATGIGAHGGPVVIEALVSHDKTIHISNPRQESAYNYPTRYGTKAPAFSRGTIRISHNGLELYIAGTASIVGSETIHIGNPTEQVRETFRNIKALMGKRNLKRYGLPGLTFEDLQTMRVYVKNPQHYLIIRKEVERIIGTNVQIIYLSSDICRPGLLVEIEAVATSSQSVDIKKA